MQVRKSIAALAFSAVAALAVYEGFCKEACIPVPGDVPTIGYGSTRYEDGEPVQMGDTIDERRALDLLNHEVGNQYEKSVRRCIKVPLHQWEYNAYVSLAYNIGGTAFCESSVAAYANQERYAEACARFDAFVCGPATRSTAAKPGQKCYSEKKPMKVLKGLQNRRASERAMCEGR
jgi:lysozyme